MRRRIRQHHDPPCDLLVVGSGAAGLYAAWRAARAGLSVILVTEGRLRSGSSDWAQGGIAAVTHPEDRIAQHIADTRAAGAGLCSAERVAVLVRDGAACVAELLAAGMPFDRGPDGQPLLGLEGGHSRHRILHAGGAETGRALVEFLISRVRARPEIRLVERGHVHRLARDAHGCVIGAHVQAHAYADRLMPASATLIATGGYAGLFARSTNPPGAVGSGLSLAAEAGARLADLEFVQFHPTAFYSPDGRTFLLTEALRGAGARLVDSTGERFLADTPGAELASRDVVAAAIHRCCLRERRAHVGLDLRHLSAHALRAGFGTLLDRVAGEGIDITRQPIPVAPAAHYCIGGVAVDENAATGIEGLYVAGEAAASGVHGANRLASNSLLECLVSAARVVACVADRAGGRGTSPADVAACPLGVRPERAGRRIAREADRAAGLMQHAGLLRDASGLAGLAARLDATPAGWPQTDEDARDERLEYHDRRDRATHQLARRIVRAAGLRTHSVGVHRRSDDVSAVPASYGAESPTESDP